MTLTAQITADLDRLLTDPHGLGLAEDLVIAAGPTSQTVRGWWRTLAPADGDQAHAAQRASAWIRPADLAAPLRAPAYYQASDLTTPWTLDHSHRPTLAGGLWELSLYRADLVIYRTPGTPPTDTVLRVFWVMSDTSRGSAQGLGASRWEAEAALTVSTAELPTVDQRRQILRDGRTYAITHVSSIGDHAWRLDLKRAEARAGSPLRGGA
jgi:hypothetical protein